MAQVPANWIEEQIVVHSLQEDIGQLITDTPRARLSERIFEPNNECHENMMEVIMGTPQQRISEGFFSAHLEGNRESWEDHRRFAHKSTS